MEDVIKIAIEGLGGTIGFWCFIIVYQLIGIKNRIREHTMAITGKSEKELEKLK